MKYEYRDVDTNPGWLKESVTKSSQTGIQILGIQGDIIIGFDCPRVDTSLKAHALVA